MSIQVLEQVKKDLGDLLAKTPELGSFLEYVEKAEAGKALDKKVKELISLGIAIAVRCEPCIIWHLNEAVKAGASLEEVLDVIKVAVCMGGGPALMYGLKAYKIALEILEKRV
ncbi:carboxymuconolactone decarboxylase family protein [Thermogladius sp. 4427co]|uniref:carboxymuconolactone decarboxylase family protein n=1 Tax=Thermogladius sp. 4427co TaxID=3450718 RepID=UPI003F78F5F9